MKIKLFEHNQIAYQAALTMMKSAGKAAVVHPTGTGKSFIGFKLCEDFPDRVICWLSPSEYIFKTQVENLAASGAFHGDDQTVSGDQEKPVLKNVKFYTYAKLMTMTEEELGEISPDYIILDEFHRCGAAQWGGGVERLCGMYQKAKVLGLSATSIRYLDNQRDMAWELFEGNIASELTLGEAIARGILPMPTYILSIYSYQKELKRCEAQIQRTKNSVVREKAEQQLEALRRALEQAEGLDQIFAKYITPIRKRKECIDWQETLEPKENKTKIEKLQREKETGKITKETEETKKYFEDLFEGMGVNKSIMVDGLIATHSLDDISTFFDDLRIIIVRRDPRDVYLSEKYIWRTDTVPREVADFCKWFRVRMNSYNYQKSVVLNIRFEDLIFDYENTVSKIEHFSGINSNTHVARQKYFIPEVSRNNCRIWERYPNEKKNMKIIEKELSEWIYPYTENLQ